MELTAVLTPAEEGGYAALNPETGDTTAIYRSAHYKKPEQIPPKARKTY